MRKKELGAIIAGIGVEIIFLILSTQVTDMPVAIAVSGYIVGGLLIIYGLIFLFLPIGQIWRIIMSIRFRLPFFMKQHNTQPISEPTSLTSTDYVQRYADWMSTAINDDLGDLSGCVIVDKPYISWEHLEERGDAYIEFNFNIWSSSVHLLEINKIIEGNIWFQDGELQPTPVITQKASQLVHLRRSRATQFTVRQWLSFTVKTDMKTKYNNSVEFGFGGVNISVTATLPDGSQGHSFRLPIPVKVCATMPNHPNAPVPNR